MYWHRYGPLSLCLCHSIHYSYCPACALFPLFLSIEASHIKDQGFLWPHPCGNIWLQRWSLELFMCSEVNSRINIIILHIDLKFDVNHLTMNPSLPVTWVWWRAMSQLRWGPSWYLTIMVPWYRGVPTLDSRAPPSPYNSSSTLCLCDTKSSNAT